MVLSGLEVATCSVAEVVEGKGCSCIIGVTQIGKEVIERLAFEYDRVSCCLSSVVIDTDLGAEVIENSELKIEIIILTAVFLVVSVQLYQVGDISCWV